MRSGCCTAHYSWPCLRSSRASPSCSIGRRAICSPSPTLRCSAPSWRSEPFSCFSVRSAPIAQATSPWPSRSWPCCSPPCSRGCAGMRPWGSVFCFAWQGTSRSCGEKALSGGARRYKLQEVTIVKMKQAIARARYLVMLCAALALPFPAAASTALNCFSPATGKPVLEVHAILDCALEDDTLGWCDIDVKINDQWLNLPRTLRSVTSPGVFPEASDDFVGTKTLKPAVTVLR